MADTKISALASGAPAQGTDETVIARSGANYKLTVANIVGYLGAPVTVANGGTGAATLTGYVKGNGTSAMTASATVPGSDVSGNITGNAANVTGTVAVANGGTGQTTYTDGQLLIGNTTGNTLTKATLTAGSGVSITNGSGSITIAATGGSGTVTSVSGTGTVNGLTLTGTVTSSGSLTLGGTLDLSSPPAIGGTAPNTGAFTSITSTSASGILTRAAATQDAVEVIGRAGGTSSYKVTLTPTTLSASRTLTLPDVSGTVLTTGAAVTVAQGGTGATTLTGIVKGNGTSAFTAATAGTDYVAPATATTFTAAQTFNGSSSVLAAVFANAAETATISATAATGTINYDVTTQSVVYYTSNASANWTVNFRGSSGTSLNTLMSTGQSITVAFLVTQGSTAYYNSAVQIDGSAVTPKYQGGTAWSAGNASGIDAYVYTIVKTGSAAFTVFASQTQFK